MRIVAQRQPIIETAVRLCVDYLYEQDVKKRADSPVARKLIELLVSDDLRTEDLDFIADAIVNQWGMLNPGKDLNKVGGEVT